VLIREGQDPLVGLVLDERYRLMRLLGTGGMGFVYEAEQLGLGRPVAVKMLYAERTRDRTSVKRFQREAHALASLAHPGIVRVIDYGDLDGRHPYLVMERVLGPPLDGVLRRMGRLPPRVAVDVGAQLADAVGAAHRGGIVHRDLKPANVHLGLDGVGRLQARVLDFGLAQIVAKEDDEVSAQTRLTRKGVIFGTPEYMAPEQVRGLGADRATDLYALGIVLYEMLVGDPPFVGASAAKVLAQQAETPPPHLPSLDGVPPDALKRLDGVIQELLAKGPEDRPHRAEDAARALRRLLPPLPDPGPLVSLLGSGDGAGDRSDVPTLVVDGDDDGESGDRDDVFEGMATAHDADRALARTLSAAGRGRRVRWALAAVGALLVALAVSPWIGRWLRGGGPGPTTPGFVETGPLLEVTSAPGDPPTGAATLPGGEAQARYEARLRELQTALAARGLRPEALTVLPQARSAWSVQQRAAAAYRFDEAAVTLERLRDLAASTPNEQLLRLAVRQRARQAPDDVRPALEALAGEVPEAASSAAGTRRLLDRVEALDSLGPAADEGGR